MKLSQDCKCFLAVGGLLVWCFALIAFRVQLSGTFSFLFMYWNLFLAGIPFAAGKMLRSTCRNKNGFGIHSLLWLGLWLLFLPNAPYILTDFIHLSRRPPIPLWYDLALILSCAGTGLLMGYVSLLDVHEVIERRYGRMIGWLVASSALLLSAFGIYLGRFLRWNSWEVLTQPKELFLDILHRVMHPTAHPRTYGMTLIFGIGLLLGYVALRVLFLKEEGKELPNRA